ncbi:TPA: hypothetical protein ACIO89_005229, partial [Salmonella enterica subsp. enterica serovar Java]
KLVIQGAPGIDHRMLIAGLITVREAFISKQLSVRQITSPPGQGCLALQQVLMMSMSIFIAARLVECLFTSAGWTFPVFSEVSSA